MTYETTRREDEGEDPAEPDPPPQFTTDMFYVNSRDGTPIESKYLQDDFGNFIMDQNRGTPYIVPYHFNPSEIVNAYAQYNLSLPAQQANVMAPAQVMAMLYRDFHAAWPGSRFDLQRNYNGVAGTDIGKFSASYTPAASWAYGFAVAVVGLPQGTALMGGGAQNLISSLSSDVDTSGTYYNAQVNVDDITTGYVDYAGGGVAAIEPPDESFHRAVEVEGVRWEIDITIHDSDTADETMVQVGTNQETGEKTVSIQTEEWGVNFGSESETDWWNNADDHAPPEEVYDYYDGCYDDWGYGYMRAGDTDEVHSVAAGNGRSPSGRFRVKDQAGTATDSGLLQHEQLTMAVAGFDPVRPAALISPPDLRHANQAGIAVSHM